LLEGLTSTPALALPQERFFAAEGELLRCGGLVGRTPLGTLRRVLEREQFDHWDAKTKGEPTNVPQRWITVASLNAAEISDVHARTMGDLFLREPDLNANASHMSPECKSVGIQRQPSLGEGCPDAKDELEYESIAYE